VPQLRLNPGRPSHFHPVGLTVTGAVGPVVAVVTDVGQPGLRATAISTVTATQNLLGLAVGPVLTGLLADL
jgi:hypothetical protein